MVPAAHAWQVPFTQTWALGQAIVAVHCTVQPIGFEQLWQDPLTQTFPDAQGEFGPHWVGQFIEPAEHAAWQTPFTHERLEALQLESAPFPFGQQAWPA